MKIPAQEESMALDGSVGRVRRIPYGDAYYLDGEVVTEFGIVTVYSKYDTTRPHSRYDFAWRGRLHIRTEWVGRTDRGLAIEATKFARRIAGAK